jgi:hypothetical protein
MKRAEIEGMSGAELVAAYNAMRPEKPVARFASHSVGVRRVLTALGEEAPAAPVEEPAAPTPESATAEPVEAAAAPVKAKAAPAPADAAPSVEKPARQSRVTAYAATPGGKEPRPASKRGLLLVALRGDGITIDEMIARFEWTKLDCRDALRLLGKQNGVASALGEDGRWRAE